MALTHTAGALRPLYCSGAHASGRDSPQGRCGPPAADGKTNPEFGTEDTEMSMLAAVAVGSHADQLTVVGELVGLPGEQFTAVETASAPAGMNFSTSRTASAAI